MKLNVIALALAASAFAFSAQAQTVVVKERAPGVTVTATTGTAVRHCTNRKVTTINPATGTKVTKTVRRCN